MTFDSLPKALWALVSLAVLVWWLRLVGLTYAKRPKHFSVDARVCGTPDEVMHEIRLAVAELGEVRDFGPSYLTLAVRYRPVWAAWLALTFFPFGLLFLNLRQDASAIVVAHGAGQGWSMVRLSGDFDPDALIRIRHVIESRFWTSQPASSSATAFAGLSPTTAISTAPEAAGRSGRRVPAAVGAVAAATAVIAGGLVGFGMSRNNGVVTIDERSAPTTVASNDSVTSTTLPTITTVTSGAAEAGGCPTGPGLTGCRAGEVTYVVDGDTVQLGGGPQIRFLGMDTPERGRCGYNEATARVSELIDDKSVTVVHAAGNTTDKYGRELGYIEVDGVDVGRLLIAEGFAHARYDSLDGYEHHPRQDDYRAVDAATTHRCEITSRTTNPPVIPTTTVVPTGAPDTACHPSYVPCLPVTGDLDCGEIGHKVRVVRGTDPYRLDSDSDGLGCESFPDPPDW